MIKKRFKIKTLLLLILISSILLILVSCKQLNPNINKNNSISQGRIIDKIDSKLGESSVANQEQKLLEGQDINLAAFIQNEGSTSTFNSISENIKEILKNKKVYIFRCKLEK